MMINMHEKCDEYMNITSLSLGPNNITMCNEVKDLSITVDNKLRVFTVHK